MNIIPAILPKTKNELLEKLAELPKGVQTIQIDVCDGDFVRAKTWPFTELDGTYKFSELLDGFEKHVDPIAADLKPFSIELDLMVSDADGLCALWDLFNPEHVIFHLDSLASYEWLATQFALTFNAYSWLRPEKTIFALTSQTDPEKLRYFYDYFECKKVQVMGIAKIGNQGEPFDQNVISYIHKLYEMYPNLEIQVDGGMNDKTIKELKRVGIEKFVCGSSVFNGDVKSNIEKLESLV